MCESCRRRTSLLRGTILLAALLAFVSCRRNPSPGVPSESPPPNSAASSPSPKSVDAALEACFNFVSGLSGDVPVPGAWEGDAAWKDFKGLADAAWTDFNAAVLAPMATWAAGDLGEARKATVTLFYPFGGPDFSTVDALFPGAPKTVLMGLEPVGNLPDPGRTSAEWRAAFLADLGELVSGFLRRGYFITREMNDIYSRGRVDGALPVIAFFLKRGGYSVLSVERLAHSAAGGWEANPYERLTVRPRRPYGVKVDYLRPGETGVRSVYYFSCDVENSAFEAGSPLYRLFDGFERLTTFVKSGSYLLHWNNFSALRQFILDRSLFVLQDDTAIPYRFFVNRGWEIRLFGRYVTPVKDFVNVEQPDLRAAYEDPKGDVRPLPFHFGYRWRTQNDNLLLARRPRRPYKAPGIR